MPGMPRTLKKLFLVIALGAPLWWLPGPRVSQAADKDNCLMCHRYRGLARVAKDGTYRLFFVDEELFSRGPHARVSCKGCHTDIDKIPHENVKEVDCLQACHIEQSDREILFTHKGVQKHLMGSAHASVDAEGKPREHAEDFPQCKDCHDNPLYRPVSIHKTARAGVSERTISRCTVCHKDETFVRYFYSHVTSRLHKARDSREVVEMCSSCHSDPALRKRHNLPDVVASYLETYHGKAVLFGSRRAPDCLDCHVREGNVHQMRAKSDPLSAVNMRSRALTCGTADCHPSAGPKLASFDVHSTRDPERDPIEFAVALFFVLMTLGVLLPIITLNVLGYIREMFPSDEAEEELERLIAAATKKAEREKGILRFSVSQRIQHAFLVLCFVLLTLTGLPMKFPEAPWADFVFGLLGGINGAPIIHRVAAIAMLGGFAFHVVSIFLQLRRSLGMKEKRGPIAWIRAVFGLPMLPGPGDLRDIIAYTRYVLFLSPKRPAYGRFSWKEKLEYMGLFWGIPLLAVTGFLLWGETLGTRALPGWLLNVAYLAHTYESFLAVAHITLVHIPGVLVPPGASPLSAMIFSGKIDPRALAEEHGAELEEHGAGPAEWRVELEKPDATPNIPRIPAVIVRESNAEKKTNGKHPDPELIR